MTTSKNWGPILSGGASTPWPFGAYIGKTALQVACPCGNEDLVKSFTRGVDANAGPVADYGATPTYFIIKGADGLEESYQDAARFAEAESRLEIAWLLREFRKV
jgi:hypothetical protein